MSDALVAGVRLLKCGPGTWARVLCLGTVEEWNEGDGGVAGMIGGVVGVEYESVDIELECGKREAGLPVGS